MFYRVPVHRGKSSISQSTDLWVCGKSAFSPTCEWTWTSVNTSCLPHPTDTPKNHIQCSAKISWRDTLISYGLCVEKNWCLENSNGHSGCYYLLIKVGKLMLMHFIIRNRLSWPPVHLVSTLSLIADNGPSAEIHKTVSIFLRGKIYRSLVYPVVSKLGLHLF